jgi:hypothetical protein
LIDFMQINFVHTHISLWLPKRGKEEKRQMKSKKTKKRVEKCFVEAFFSCFGLTPVKPHVALFYVKESGCGGGGMRRIERLRLFNCWCGTQHLPAALRRKNSELKVPELPLR